MARENEFRNEKGARVPAGVKNGIMNNILPFYNSNFPFRLSPSANNFVVLFAPPREIRKISSSKGSFPLNATFAILINKKKKLKDSGGAFRYAT